jgi:hypothetical protein
MEGKMIEQVLEEVRTQAGLGGPTAALANEMLVATEQYQSGEMTREEFDFLIKDIANVQAATQLANDEVACRWVIAAATTIISVV